MSLELIRESARINHLTGEQSSQTIVEHDIIVPDINPDVLRILILDGEVIEKTAGQSFGKRSYKIQNTICF